MAHCLVSACGARFVRLRSIRRRVRLSIEHCAMMVCDDCIANYCCAAKLTLVGITCDSLLAVFGVAIVVDFGRLFARNTTLFASKQQSRYGLSHFDNVAQSALYRSIRKQLRKSLHEIVSPLLVVFAHTKQRYLCC